MRRPRFSYAAMLALAAGTPAAAFEPSPPLAARSHLIPGELTRVDLARRSIVVKPKGTEAGEAREVEAWTGADTRVTARGRVLRLEDLRPGDRVLVSCADVGGRHEARVVKVVARTAAPAPTSPPGAATPSSPGAPSPGASPFD